MYVGGCGLINRDRLLASVGGGSSSHVGVVVITDGNMCLPSWHKQRPAATVALVSISYSYSLCIIVLAVVAPFGGSLLLRVLNYQVLVDISLLPPFFKISCLQSYYSLLATSIA